MASIVTNSEGLLKLLERYHQCSLMTSKDICQLRSSADDEVLVIDLDHAQGMYSPKLIREGGSRVPIIGITEQLFNDQGPQQTITFLESGGSHLLEDPVDLKLLLAYITEVSRRFRDIGSRLRLMENRLIINTTEQTVLFDKKPVHFSTQERSIMMYLAEHFGQTCNIHALHRSLYSGWGGEESSMPTIVRTLISRIRGKLNEVEMGLGKELVMGTKNEGYQLVDIIKTQGNSPRYEH